MKKINKLFVVGLSAMMLTSCGFLGNLGDLVGGEETGTDTLKYDLEATKANVKKLASTTGFEISMSYYSYEDGVKTEESADTYGIKDNVDWYYRDADTGCAFVFGEDNYTTRYSISDGEWYYTDRIESSELEGSIDFELGLSAWMYSAHAYDGAFKKNGTTTIAGRKCDIYEYKFNAIIEKVEYSFAVDQETGITMKYDLGASVMTESASTGFEVTSFKTSGITVPNLPPVEE